MSDNVNHPKHYTQGKIEVIDFLLDQKFDILRGNAVKYICRAPFKNNFVEDLQKAIWYLNKAITEHQKEEQEAATQLSKREDAFMKGEKR